MKTIALAALGYFVSCYAVGLLVWRDMSEDRTGMSSLWLAASPVTVPIFLWILAMDR